jgi:hypothetical protein
MKEAAGRDRDAADVVAEAIGWEAATFAGLERCQRRDVAALPPERRMEWLEAALELAAQSGALAVVRRRRQQECDAVWSGSHFRTEGTR